MADLDARRARHARLVGVVAALDDRALAGALPAPPRDPTGWGVSYPARLGDHDVFVKRIPLTDREHEQPRSTRNHYRVPTFYSYGVGSAGFGAWRELEAHLATTAWVEAGDCESFPMLHAWRVLPRAAGQGYDPAGMAAYFRRWNGSTAIRRYIGDRYDAEREIWLVLEHVPHSLWEWGATNQSRAPDAFESLFRTIDFLRANGAVHFDAHFGNVVTDGESFHLTDFGLLMSRDFALSPTERAFLARHGHYDYAEVVWCFGTTVRALYGATEGEARREAADRAGLDADADGAAVLHAVIRRLDDGRLRDAIGLDPLLAELVDRYAPLVLYMDEFFASQRANPKKDTPYDDARVARLLA